MLQLHIYTVTAGFPTLNNGKPVIGLPHSFGKVTLHGTQPTYQSLSGWHDNQLQWVRKYVKPFSYMLYRGGVSYVEVVRPLKKTRGKEMKSFFDYFHL